MDGVEVALAARKLQKMGRGMLGCDWGVGGTKV